MASCFMSPKSDESSVSVSRGMTDIGTVVESGKTSKNTDNAKQVPAPSQKRRDGRIDGWMNGWTK